MAVYTGIYQIRNTKNNKLYIGSAAKSLRCRYHQHFSALKHNNHSNRHLQSTYNKYGLHYFVWEILLLCSPKECLKYEQYFLDVLKPEYNISPTAKSSLGIKRSEETKKKLSIIHLKMYQNEEYREMMRVANINRHYRTTEKIREKISAACRGENHYNYGKHRSEETKRKIRRAHLGKQYAAASYPSFVSPTGFIYPAGKNLSAFCRKHCLAISAMCDVKNRKRKHHKEWRLSKT